MLPQWIKKNPDIVFTGNVEVDGIVKVLLETSMFVGGLLGFLLDNTVPGTDQERGLVAWRAQHGEARAGQLAATYDIPYITVWARGQRWARYVPFLPTFAAPSENDKV